MPPNLFLADLQARIDELEERRSELVAHAERLGKEEKAAVIATLKEDVATYGLTFNDLFEPDPFSAKINPEAHLRVGVPASANSSRLPNEKVPIGQVGTPWIAYRDEKGNQWVGLGRRPKWVQRYISNGGDLDLLRAHADLNRPE